MGQKGPQSQSSIMISGIHYEKFRGGQKVAEKLRKKLQKSYEKSCEKIYEKGNEKLAP